MNIRKHAFNNIENCRNSSTHCSVSSLQQRRSNFISFPIPSAPNRSHNALISRQEMMRTPESVNCWERTLVLVGKVGNGKSATGNSIIGHEVFDSKTSSAGVTSSCQLETTELDDGHILNVIDTPGLYDPSVELNVIAKEIAKCIDLDKDGIHAVLLVLSIRNRFSPEEASAFEGFRQIFGPQIVDRMIVVFTNGDALGRNGCLDDFVGESELLTSTVEMCGGRRVLFDNGTDNEVKMFRQRKELLSLVNDVVDNNGGMPYTSDLFDELKNGDWNLIDPEISDGGQQGQRFERLIMMVESRLREGMERLEKQLEEERAARQEAEARAQSAEASSKEEIQKLAATLERAQLEAEARERAARQEAEAKAQEAEARSKEEMHKLTALLEMSRLEAEARERAAREEAEAKAKAQEAEARSKEERDKLAALLESARSEAEAREKGAREEAEAEAQEAEKMSRLEAEAKMQHLNLEKLVGLMLERSPSEAEAKVKHLSWEIQNIRNRKGSVMKVMMQHTFSDKTEMN